MTETEVLQIVGSAVMFTFAALLFLIARSNGYWQYGRDSLACASAFIMSQVIVRFLAVPAGILSQTDARTVNGLTAIVALVILLQISLFIHVAVQAERNGGNNAEGT